MIERSIRIGSSPFIIPFAAMLALLFAVPAAYGYTVKTAENPSHVEAFAAAELAKYCEAMGIKAGSTPQTIEVGRTPGNTELATSLAQPLNEAAGEAFAVVVTDDGTVRLVGGGDRGTLYAVYRFLEIQGCRFFSPADEVVPERTSFDLTPRDEKHVPSNFTREIGGGTSPDVGRMAAADWTVKNRLNRAFALRPALEPKGTGRKELHEAWVDRGQMQDWQWIAHNFGFVFKADENWFERHPEYYAMYEGRRRRPGTKDKPHHGGGNLALTQQGVIDHCVKFTREWFDKNPEGLVMPLWPNDGAIYWDESPKAMKLGGKNFTPGPEGSMTRRLVMFCNAVAKEVYKTHPDRLILLPAYSNYILPLEDGEVELAPNIFVQYCYHADYAHGPEQSPKNAEPVRRMRAWANQSPHFGVWEYFLIGDINATDTQPILLPLVYRSRDTLQFLEGIGSTRYFTQANRVYHPDNALLFYALARLIWDPSLDVDALIEDYCLHSFGESAGPAMAEFFIAMEKACEASDWRPMTYADVAVPSPSVFTDEVLVVLEEKLASAEGATKTDKQTERLQQLRDAFESTKRSLSVASLVNLSPDQPWRLGRMQDVYLMNSDGDDVDPKRFEDVVRHAMDTGQGGPALRRLIFRAQKRGEPVARLENERWRLDVVPGLGGRAIRLIDKTDGWNYFREQPGSNTLDSIGSHYFNYGGYEEYVGHGFAGPGWEDPFEVVDTADDEGHTLTLKAEGDGWSIRRQYQLDESTGELVIRSTVTNTTEKDRTLALRTHPQFDLGGNVGTAVLLAPKGKQWTQVDALRGVHDQLRELKTDAEAVWHPSTGRGITLSTNLQKTDAASGPLKGYMFVANDGTYFQIERFGPNVALAPGEGWSIEQRIRPLRPDEAAETLGVKTTGNATPQLAWGGAVSQWVDGVKGKGVVVDAPRGLPAPGWLLPSDEATLSFWFQRPDTKGPAAWLMSMGDNRDGWFILSAESDKLQWMYKQGKTPHDQPNEAYLSLGAMSPAMGEPGWHHVTLTWKSDPATGMAQVSMWIDGEPIDRRPAVKFPTSLPPGPWVLGGNSASATPSPMVHLDELRVYKKVLSDGQIAALAKGESIDEPASAHIAFDGDRMIKRESAK